MGRRHRLQLLGGTFSLAFSPPSTFCRRFGTFLRHRLLMLTLPLSLRPRFGFLLRLRCCRLTICLFLHCQCGGQPIHLCLYLGGAFLFPWSHPCCPGIDRFVEGRRYSNQCGKPTGFLRDQLMPTSKFSF